MKTSLSLDDINQAIVGAAYYVFPGTTMTVCCLTLKDGFTVLGESACIDPLAFNEALGRQLAHQDAVAKVWKLEAYLAMYLNRRGADKVEPALMPDHVVAAHPIVQGLKDQLHGALDEVSRLLHLNKQLADNQKPSEDAAPESRVEPGAPEPQSAAAATDAGDGKVVSDTTPPPAETSTTDAPLAATGNVPKELG